MISNIIQIAFLITFCVAIIRLHRHATNTIMALQEENKKIRENYNNTLKDLMDSYHMLIATYDGHVTHQEIQDFINKPKKK